MDFKIAVLAGDGIGPEISVQGVDVMTAVCEKFGHKVSYEYAICGADAIDKVGNPFPRRNLSGVQAGRCRSLSAVGDPKFDNDPTAKVANRDCWPCARSWDSFRQLPGTDVQMPGAELPLKAELVDGADSSASAS